MTRMPGAIWRPISRNYTNRRRARTNACINHVDAGNATSLHGWFNDPAAKASSHLFVKRGTPAQIRNGQRADIEQYIDLDLISWCNGKGDARAVTVETAGYGHGEWDPAQCLALIHIWQFVHAHYGVPLTLMRDSKPTTAGIGYHLLGVPANATQKRAGLSQTGGELWSSSVGKICPGPDRVRQMPDLVARAAGGTHQAVKGVTVTAPTPTTSPAKEYPTMRLIQAADSKQVAVTDGVTKRYISDPKTLGDYQKMCGPIEPIGQYTYDRIPNAITNIPAGITAKDIQTALAEALRSVDAEVDTEAIAASVAERLAGSLKVDVTVKGA